MANTRAPTARAIWITHRSDPAGAAVDEHVFAHLQLRLAEQPQVRGDADQRRGRRVLIGDFLGRRIEPALVDRGVLGERSLASEQPLVAAPDAVALAILRHARPDRLDHAGQIAADDKRLRQSTGIMPARMYVSTGLTATASTLTRTWLAAGFGLGRSP